MEVWDPKPIGAGAKVRQLLHAPGGRSTRVDGAWLRVRRRGATGAPLVLRLERPDGQALASATLAPGDVPSGGAGGCTCASPSPCRWRRAPISR